MADLDLNDPTTWPETLADIESVADTALAPDLRKGYVETEDPAEETAAAEQPTEAPADGAQTAPQEPGWVLLADGKHAMPYEQFRAQRAEAEAAKAEAQQLRAELDAIRRGDVADVSQTATQGQTLSAGSLEAKLQAALAKQESLRADDPDLAEAMEAGIAALEDQIQVRREREAEQQWAAQQQQAQQSEAIKTAVAANPVLSAWVEDPVWFQRARDMEQTMAHDPASAYSKAGDWNGKFAAVVAATEAVYGPSPARQYVRPVQDLRPGTVPVKPLAAPVSMSAMLGGEDAISGDELQALSRMTPQQMMAHLGELAEKDALAGLIARVS